MLQNSKIVALLDQLARRFENQQEQPAGLPAGSEASGWGQFLDAPKHVLQVGLYGTSAGLLVLTQAGRGNSEPIQHALELLGFWWGNDQGLNYGAEKFAQTLRLAFLNLALGLSAVPEARRMRDEIAARLLSELQSNGLWGNFARDPSPQLFPTAIALMSYTLATNGQGRSLDPKLGNVADRLEERLLASSSLPPHETAAIVAAVLSARKTSLQAGTSRQIRRLATRIINLAETGIYHYEYEAESSTGNIKYDRDYFIVPTEILLAIAGLQSSAPTLLRLRAEAAIELLAANIDANEAFKSSTERRVTSKNQAWAALLLGIAAAQTSPSTGLLSRLWYHLCRQRSENWLTIYVLPLLSLILVTAATVVTKDATTLVRLEVGIETAILSAIYGPSVLARLLPGRS